MVNRMKEKLMAGEVVLGAQLRFGSPAIAELFGHAGFDYVVFDSEHAPQTPVGIQQQIQAVGCTPATPIVRMLRNDPDQMRPFLDMGAAGVLVPFVCTGEEARLGARALRYPPVGTRGYGPARASRYGLDGGYFEAANAEMVYIPIIEDEQAVRNCEAILAVDGVDTFVIGPVDLSISMGIPMQFDHPRFREAEREVVRAARAAGKPLGTCVYGGDLYDPDTYRRFLDEGFRLLLVGGDEWLLSSACRRLVECVAPLRDRLGGSPAAR
jgi:2-keto-3-deoxy-L-rhamnonate aldolase RhmA